MEFKFYGDNYGLVFSPVYLLMLANELLKSGVAVTLTQDVEHFDVDGLPSDSYFNADYSRLRKLVESVTGKGIVLEDLEVDYELYRDETLYGVLTSFGCKFRCSYCPHEAHAYTPRPIDKVYKELDYVIDNSNYFEFLDNSLLNNPQWKQIVTRIGGRSKWGTLLNILDYPTEDLLTLRDNGCINLYLGLESFLEEDLMYLNKPYIQQGIDPKDYLLKLKALGFNVYVFIIRGLPNETEESFNTTTQWLKDNDIGYSIARFFKDGVEVTSTKYLSENFLQECKFRDIEVSENNFKQFIDRTLSVL